MTITEPTTEAISGPISGPIFGHPTSEDVAAVIEDVWVTFLGDDALPGPFERVDQTDAAARTPSGVVWSAAVTVSGPAPHIVTVTLSEGGATFLAQHMLQADDLTTEDVADCVGELVNVIGGNVKGLLPPPSTLSLPVATTGTFTHSSGATLESCLATSLAGHGVNVTVHSVSGGSAPADVSTTSKETP